MPEMLSHEEIVSKLGLIFREDELDEFVPPDYRNALNRAASPGPFRASPRRRLPRSRIR